MKKHKSRKVLAVNEFHVDEHTFCSPSIPSYERYFTQCLRENVRIVLEDRFNLKPIGLLETWNINFLLIFGIYSILYFWFCYGVSFAKIPIYILVGGNVFHRLISYVVLDNLVNVYEIDKNIDSNKRMGITMDFNIDDGLLTFEFFDNYPCNGFVRVLLWKWPKFKYECSARELVYRDGTIKAENFVGEMEKLFKFALVQWHQKPL